MKQLNGTKSPLLDFSTNKYNALFFACEDYTFTSSKNAKLFCLDPKRTTGATQCTSNYDPQYWMYKVGAKLDSTLRHYNQYAQYLVPIKFQRRETDNKFNMYFCPFEDALKYREDDFNMLEIIIKESAKEDIARTLEEQGTHQYSIYGDEDSLEGYLGNNLWKELEKYL